MKLMLTFTLTPDSRDAAIERFEETGGQTPQGVTLLGRWTAADLSCGFVLIESNDLKAVTEFALMWSDLIEVNIMPVLDDAELTDVLGRRD